MSLIFYKIRDECKKQINETVFDKSVKKDYCELIWDGIMCWNKTKPGVEVSRPCPEYFGFSPMNMVTKRCTDLGKWFVHEEFNTTWTNYSQCKSLIDNKTHMVNIPTISDLSFFHFWLPKIKILKHTGYGLSLITLLLAIVIFLFFKKLQCARIRLHMHLFLSFAIKAFTTLLKDFLFVDGIVLAEDLVVDGTNKYVKEHNSWMCKAITSFWQYSIQTNYFLIFMEGIYLHNLLFRSLNSQVDNIYTYIFFGWGLPYCFIIPWVILKILYEDEYCWTKKENKYYEYLIHIPIVITTLINFILFSKIVNILLIKLNTIQRRRIKYRRLIRSTLILMPLFGVPYMISILVWYNATENEIVELIWIFFDQTFTSLQGFFVAFLYCLSNSDVRNELKKHFLPQRNSDKHKINSFPLYATISNRFSFTTDNNERQCTS